MKARSPINARPLVTPKLRHASSAAPASGCASPIRRLDEIVSSYGPRRTTNCGSSPKPNAPPPPFCFPKNIDSQGTQKSEHHAHRNRGASKRSHTTGPLRSAGHTALLYQESKTIALSQFDAATLAHLAENIRRRSITSNVWGSTITSASAGCTHEKRKAAERRGAETPYTTGR